MHPVKCFLYVAGLYLTFAFDDLSFKAVASQSKIATGQPISYAASNAVDREIATCTRAEEIGMNAPDKTMWWKVDLNGTFNIFSINILFKNYKNYDNRQRGRLAGFSLYVSNTGVIQGSSLCYKDGPQLPPLNFTTECIESGRYVIFYNERFFGVSYPTGYELDNVFTELCEVIVKGCKQHGVYGSKCDIPCPVKCKGNTCHILSGACFDCENGVYGGYCNLSCPNSCKDNICNMQSGACLECEHGVYGRYCNLSCPINCKDNTCHIQNGTCFACTPGWTGITCDTKCTEGWYGVRCGLQCSGHCRNVVTCDHVTGQCVKGCDAGWTGVTCKKECDDGTYGYGCNKNCSGHCRDDFPCNKLSGQCDGGCDPGYTDAYCSTECKPSFFGLDCKERCSGHCENNEPCNHVSGVCPAGCQDGYMDEYCNSSCKAGRFGKNCSFQCPPNCNGPCVPIDGLCKDCKEGSKGYCSKECRGGWYGVNCSQQCSGHCKDNATCNHVTGQCDKGCEVGWTGTLCEQACSKSFGENCRYQCSPHCFNQTCDRFNGRCLYCCTDGFHGELCDKAPENESSINCWSVELLFSLIINFVFISGACFLFRGIYTKKVTISREFLSCTKKSIYYTDTDVKMSEDSTYQELDISRDEIPYQNTTIH